MPGKNSGPISPWIPTLLLLAIPLPTVPPAGLVGGPGPGAFGPVPQAPSDRVIPPEEIVTWSAHSFEGYTQYELVEIDGRSAVHAVCDEGTASGLFLEEEIDLTRTPILEWEWRVDATFEGIDETTRAGDDYAARIYAVREGGLRVWRTRALNYVWASEMEKGSDWPNAYQSRAHMLALRSGADEAERGWQTERRNLRKDFEGYHGEEVEKIDALAIMTDCDDVGEPVEAWYGEIRLLGPGPQGG